MATIEPNGDSIQPTKKNRPGAFTKENAKENAAKGHESRRKRRLGGITDTRKRRKALESAVWAVATAKDEDWKPKGRLQRALNQLFTDEPREFLRILQSVLPQAPREPVLPQQEAKRTEQEVLGGRDAASG